MRAWQVAEWVKEVNSNTSSCLPFVYVYVTLIADIAS